MTTLNVPAARPVYRSLHRPLTVAGVDRRLFFLALLVGAATFIVGSLVVLFVNLFAVFYAATRWLFLKDTGRKLAHVDRQLHTPDTVVRDLSERLAREE